jgi:hypothetical protein
MPEALGIHEGDPCEFKSRASLALIASHSVSMIEK